MKAHFLYMGAEYRFERKTWLAFCTIKAHAVCRFILTQLFRTHVWECQSLWHCAPLHPSLYVDDASSLNPGRTWGQMLMKGSLGARHSLPYLLLHLFFAIIPGNNCHYHVTDETSPESINKFSKCIQPVKNMVEIWFQGLFCVCVCVTSKIQNFPSTTEFWVCWLCVRSGEQM